jgi:ribosome maturation factor RimP
MKELDIIVDSVTYETEGNYTFLKIELDRVNGLDLDAIVEATDIINPIIDKLDLIDDSYILDISSKEKGSV